MKVVIAGGSGFIGKKFSSRLKERGDQVILLTRNPEDKDRVNYWNPSKKQINPSILEGVDVVANFAGENVMGRWSQKKKERIRSSRLDSTDLLCRTILSLNNPPKLYLGASAAGIYGDRGNEVLTESSPIGHDYLAGVAREWEALTNSLPGKGVRVALARFGLVLGEGGGALKMMVPAFRMGLGGTMGSGKHIVSWIAVDDVIGAFEHIMNHEELSGPINFTSPNPVTNREMTKTIGRVLNRPTMFSVPKPVLYLLLGSGADMFIESENVKPERLLKSGYQFKYPQLEEALKKYLLNKS